MRLDAAASVGQVEREGGVRGWGVLCPRAMDATGVTLSIMATTSMVSRQGPISESGQCGQRKCDHSAWSMYTLTNGQLRQYEECILDPQHVRVCVYLKIYMALFVQRLSV